MEIVTLYNYKRERREKMAVTSVSTSPISLTQSTKMTSSVVTNPISINFGSETTMFDREESDKQMLKAELNELVRKARALKEDSSKETKKALNERIKNLKEMAETAGVDLGELLGEILDTTNAKDSKKVQKALGIEATKAEEVEPQENNFMMNPFGRLSFGNRFSAQSFNTKSNLPELAEVGYDEEKGARLAESVIGNAKASSTGYCAAYVKRAMVQAGFESGNKSGHAYQMNDILTNDKQFKEIKVSKDDLKNLPAGCILVYGKGVAGYSKDYGHTEITLGDGRAASDFVQSGIRTSDDVRVYVPV